MSDGLEWIAGAWTAAGAELYITCARGIRPEQLARRLADHEPVETLPPVTVGEASGMVDMKQIYCVGRYSSSGEWSYVVESGCSEGRFISPDVSRDDAEVLVFDPQPDNPPAQFAYHKDGMTLLSSSLGDGIDSTHPEELIAAMRQAYSGADTASEQLYDLLRAIGHHFDLNLPKEAIMDGKLPAVVTRTSPPSYW